MKFRKFLRNSFVWFILAPWIISFAGAASNQLVLIANNDRFPVMVNAVKLAQMTAPTPEQSFITNLFGVPAPSPEVSRDDVVMIDDTHCVMTKDTHLNFLADVFDLKQAIYSVGDFALMLGSWMWSFTPIVWCTLVLKKIWDREID